VFVCNFVVVVVVERKAFLTEEQIFAVSLPFLEKFKFPSLWKRCALIDIALLFD